MQFFFLTSSCLLLHSTGYCSYLETGFKLNLAALRLAFLFEMLRGVYARAHKCVSILLTIAVYPSIFPTCLVRDSFKMATYSDSDNNFWQDLISLGSVFMVQR